MNELQQVLTAIATQPKAKVNKNKKGKWREIEELRDRFQLEKELRDYENSLEHMLDDF